MGQLQIKKARVTRVLLERLFQAPDLKTYLEGNADALAIPPFHRFISELCRDAGISRGDVIARSGIARTYGHQLFNGTRKPSRDKVIQLAFGFGLDAESAQELLKIARQTALYPKIPRDIVILHCLHKQKDMLYAQGILQEMGLTLLGGEDKNG